MRLVSWNVNGLRNVIKRCALQTLLSGYFDVVMLQEIKTEVMPLELRSEDYHAFMQPATTKKGYSGTLTLTKSKPSAVIYGVGEEKFDNEGRVLTVELDDFYVVNAYFPNSRRDLSRLNFKLEFDDRFLTYLEMLRKNKPVIVGGDFNVAHEERDIARPKANRGNAGFTGEERAWMSELIKHGYTDTFRLFVSDGGHYTWWTYRAGARENNIGWRIDYFLVSNELCPRVRSVGIMDETKGSDHVPVTLEV
jgi:exodeoxyribonuclease-3